MSGLILAAPSSGAGKTTITLGLLRALKNAGHNVRSAKSGPDYIDPQFHAAATGRPCFNLDAWAMTPARIRELASGKGDLIIEGAMGLFDGAPPDGNGSSADLGRILGVPVVLIVDAKAMSQSIAALVSGFANHDPNVRIVGVILNRVGSDRHTAMLKAALVPSGIPVLGAIPRTDALSRPSRHLGLVQAGEMPDLDDFLNTAAELITKSVDLDALRNLIGADNDVGQHTSAPSDAPQKPQRIAIARDAAFSFTYAHDLAAWARSGATILPFSPLANDPVPEADRVILPGGYPELYAAQLASNQTFMQSLKKISQTSDIYGECGGYMTLGETLIDADGTAHKMAGLLGLTTSFQTRKLHLGYRRLQTCTGAKTFAGHEFHYATTLDAQGQPLFDVQDAEGRDLGQTGLVEGRVSGSFAHIIDEAPFPPIAKGRVQA
ncbi:cobyrinate a,c-diamide synthase [Octadecabacter sp. G9-8]|uniref:Hydrogenobyrinate a,c-diamide synthase n=1 Tax=Octadecabacter dasysiphoniae TaxID=2909341 RepID=A0ABS9D358_9RHOB|nr:cobyrinate a,c-diamide synthase [Octadecabacter dasysiphoniae]MCF2872851.1 cobyrinate a,c-diamide synthase [Octadecabacter dasysiphoniae]